MTKTYWFTSQKNHCVCLWLLCSGAKVLENRITADEERIKQLEKELEMTIVFGEEADRKYEEVSREDVT